MFKFIALMGSVVMGTALDDYVSKEEDVYSWFDKGEGFTTAWGGQAHVLNVTSQTWMDESRAHGPHGAIWDHTVILVVPKELKYTNVSALWVTGNCNPGPHPIPHNDEDVLLMDELSHNTGMVSVVVKQVPNCPYIFPNDPKQMHRGEDNFIAQTWREYIDDPEHRPDWLALMPMTKSGFQAMRAAEEFMAEKGISQQIDGWTVSGASKRGWTSLLMSGIECETCSKIIATMPVVPVVPDLILDLHRQWQSYNGFTFALQPYMDVGLMTEIDGPEMVEAFQLMDPINYLDKLNQIPKYLLVSSDDEFMSMDWTNIYWEKFGGEKHLSIMPNTEHSMATGMYEAVSLISTYLRSIAADKVDRPRFDYTYDNATGEITVTVPQDQVQPKTVELRHTQTLSKERRDFRWAVEVNNFSMPNCSLPYIHLPDKQSFELQDRYGLEVKQDLCVAPMFWQAEKLSKVSINEDGDAVYHITPPMPKDGHWTGYYISLIFPGDTEQERFTLKNEYKVSTPGFTWPNTLPFEDCYLDTCLGRSV